MGVAGDGIAVQIESGAWSAAERGREGRSRVVEENRPEGGRLAIALPELVESGGLVVALEVE